MTKKEAKELFIKLTQKNVRSVSEINTGFNNQNFFINSAYVLRIPIENRDPSIIYTNEYISYKFVEPLNINEKLVYFDETTGIKLSRFIHNARLYVNTPTNEQIIDVAKLIKKLHNSKIKTSYSYQVFNKLDLYKKGVDSGDLINIKYENYIVNECKKIFDKNEMVFCHNDLVHGNLLFSFNKTYLIDWEYASMNNPFFDLASFISENNLSSEQEDLFLKKYFGTKFNLLTRKRVDLFAKLQDILFYYWAKFLLNRRGLEIYKIIANEKYQKIQNEIKTS